VCWKQTVPVGGLWWITVTYVGVPEALLTSTAAWAYVERTVNKRKAATERAKRAMTPNKKATV
jgi:hypothetical protein